MNIAGYCRDCENYDAPHCKAFRISGLEETFYCAAFKRRYKATIGGRIEALREEKGETQARLASILGVKREQIAQWEADTRGIKPERIIAIADHYGVTCDYLLRGGDGGALSSHAD